MLELVDRHDSGSCVRKGVGVQVSPRAGLGCSFGSYGSGVTGYSSFKLIFRSCPFQIFLARVL